jgi:DNA-binding protein HU-beta
VNKNELIDFIAGKSKTDISKTLVTEIVDLIFEGIESELKKGGEARFVGFGTFKVTRRKATTGRNPRTGESIKIAASNRVKFTAGKELKEAVNK